MRRALVNSREARRLDGKMATAAALMPRPSVSGTRSLAQPSAAGRPCSGDRAASRYAHI